MILYNLHTEGPDLRITKFVDGEPEGSYLVTIHECTCPAGHRATCRHRQMLPNLLAAGIVDSIWFWNFDTHRVVDFNGELKSNFDAMDELAREPDEIRGPNDIHCSHDLAIDLMAKDVTPQGPQALTQDVMVVPAGPQDTFLLRTPLPKTSWRRM